MAIRRKRLRTSSWVRTTSIEPILKRRTTLEEFESDPGESLSVVEAQFAKWLCIRSFKFQGSKTLLWHPVCSGWRCVKCTRTGESLNLGDDTHGIQTREMRRCLKSSIRATDNPTVSDV